MRNRPTVLLAGPPSDSHTWNLLYLQLLIGEEGWAVCNLGCCTPVDLLVAESLEASWDLLVIGSVNGHGYHEGMTLIQALRRQPALSNLPVVIGGKLGIAGVDHGARRSRLIDAGFLDAFEGDDAIPRFRVLLASLAARPPAVPALTTASRS